MDVTARNSDTLVYLGTVDDKVLDYPWPNIEIGRNFLIDTILDHVLFGAPMLINDGYLINHPLARDDLLKGKNSLILSLIRQGFIKVLTRVADLDKLHLMPLEMASQSNQTFEDRISRSDWERLQFTLQSLGESLSPHFNSYRWPPVDMGDGFRVLLENAIQGIDEKGFESLGMQTPHSEKVVSVINKIANRLAKDTTGARNLFEITAIEESKALSLGEDKKFVHEMMGLANEIYHFNFGIQLDNQLHRDGMAVVAETRLSRAFDDLLAVEERVIELEGSLPLIGRPEFVTSLDPATLTAIVDRNTEVGEAKFRYQDFMRRFASGEYTLEEATDFAAQYERALIHHFSSNAIPSGLKRVVNVGMTLSAALVGASFPTSAASSVAANVGLGTLSSQIGEPRLMRLAKRFYSRTMSRDFEQSRTHLKPHVSRAILSSLRFHPDVTGPIARKAKRFD